MTSQRTISIVHKNDLSAYLGDWKNVMNIILKAQPPVSLPQTLISFSNNTYDLSLMLSYLDDKLTILEGTPLIAGQRIDYQAYAEARVFLKASYLFFRILLDDVSGILEYFYKKNELNVKVEQSFDDLLKKAKNRKLPEDLSKLLERPSSWFPEMKDRRDDLVHRYDSFLISFKQGEDGKTILGHFSIKGLPSSMCDDIRKYFGFILCEYQTLIDNLLDHFDTKFGDWYGIMQGKSGRTISIMEGCVALPLWWAYKYGNYRHKDLQVNEG